MEDVKILRQKILDLTTQYYELAHARKEFVPGTTRITYAGRVFDAHELKNGVESILDFWLTSGRYAA